MYVPSIQVEFGRVERPLPTAESESRPSTSLAGSNGSGLYVPLLSTKYLSSEKENVASWKPVSSYAMCMYLVYLIFALSKCPLPSDSPSFMCKHRFIQHIRKDR